MLMKIFLVSAAILGICQGGVTFGRHEKNAVNQGIKPYIMGGTIVKDRIFPSVVSIRHNAVHVCGGTILNENWIVTAAQCVENVSPNSITAVVGSNLLSSGDTHELREIKIHEGYDVVNSWKNDIALLQVQQPMKFTWGLRPAKLPPPGKTADYLAPGTIVGWGSLKAGGEFSNELRRVALIVGDTNKCNGTYHDYHLNVFDTQFCDGGAGGIATCDGDMGGPNFVDDELYGIVSWNWPCGHGGFPTVYTKVSEYIDWITGHIN